MTPNQTKLLKKFNAGKFHDAKRLAKKAIQKDKRDTLAIGILNNIYLENHQISEAEGLISKAERNSADTIQLYYPKAKILMYQKRYTEAIELLEKLVEQQPKSNNYRTRLAQCYRNIGKYNLAISHYNALLNANHQLNEVKVELFYCLKYSLPQNYKKNLENDILCYLTFENVNHNYLSSYTSLLLVYKYQLDIANQSIELNDLAHDQLLMRSLRLMVLPNPKIEQLLTGVRKVLLNQVISGQDIPINQIELIISLAIQQYINEYIYLSDKAEEEAINALIEQLNSTLGNKNFTIDELLAPVILIAMYRPLSSLECSQKLVQSGIAQWPEIIRPLIELSLFDNDRELKVAADIPRLNIIDDITSVKVKQQYEENPYPRWKTASFSRALSYKNTLQTRLIGFNAPLHLDDNPLRILVAGCGTGKHAIELAKFYPKTKITAVDLSCRSLAYAKIKSENYQINNVSFVNADILNLTQLNRKFNIIESIGVLHHMKEPEKGWSVLTELLVPQGIMKIGLYSELARQPIVKAREIIKTHHIDTSNQGIREFRHNAMQGIYGKDIQLLACNSLDFFSMSGCRDLFFHVQEHRYTCEKIQHTLDYFNLNFLGFSELNPLVESLYRKEFPDENTMTSLQNWAVIEQLEPRSFGGMYQFWCQKQ